MAIPKTNSNMIGSVKYVICRGIGSWNEWIIVMVIKTDDAIATAILRGANNVQAKIR